MWKKIAPLLIALSVAINIAFVGVWVVHAVGSRCGHGVSYREANKNGKMDCPLYRDLGVSREQWKQIEPRLVEFCNASQSICREVSRKRTEMIHLLAASPTDSKAVAAKQEEILAGQRRMQQLVIEHLLDEKQVLTPEQQKKFFNLLRQRSGCVGHGFIRGIVPGKGSSPWGPRVGESGRCCERR